MKYERLTIRQFKNYEDRFSKDTIYTRLQELEDKIENGTLIELPCKVGDDAYFVVKHEEDWVIEIGYIKAISIDKDGIWIACHYSTGFSYWHHCKDRKLCFKANEAEAKLKELKGK